MKLDQLTFTRFVAAISIVVFHYGKDVFPFNFDITSFLFRQANIGVSYFFILSGFVMTIAYSQKREISFLDYMKRRFARIYPVYFIAIVILTVYFIIVKDLENPFDLSGLFLNLTMIQAWIPGKASSFNSPGWSLSIELFFYATFPLLFNKIYSKQPLKVIILPILLLFVVSQGLLHWLRYSSFYEGFPSKSHDFLFYFPLMHFNEFLIGSLTGLIFLKNKKFKNYDWAIILLSLVFVLILRLDIGLNYHNGLLAIIFVPLTLMISSNNGMLTKLFSKSTFVFLGEISYGIYILQMPVHHWVNGVLKYMGISNVTVVFYATLIILIAVSAFSYKYIEAPLRNAINNIGSNSKSVQQS